MASKLSGAAPNPTPLRATYGFAAFIFNTCIIILYLLWAFLPDSWLAMMRFTYYPRRYWAIAVPTYLVTALLMFGFWFYPALQAAIVPEEYYKQKFKKN